LRRDVHGGGQIVQPHFALRENHVEIDDDGHKLKRGAFVPKGHWKLARHTVPGLLPTKTIRSERTMENSPPVSNVPAGT
jgi:hypothetical protein